MIQVAAMYRKWQQHLDVGLVGVASRSHDVDRETGQPAWI